MTSPISQPTAKRSRWLRIYSVLLVVVGAALLALGGTLLALGGSAYYLVAGIATILSGILLWRGDWRGALVYAAMLLGTLVWALWEVGLEGWALVPRLVAPVVLGLPLLFGEIVRHFRGGRRATALAIASAAVVAAAIVLYMPPWDWSTKPQPVPGPVPAAIAGDAGDWRFYGNSQHGTRFSPLAQIAAANVRGLEVAWSTHVDQDPGGIPKVRFNSTPLKVGDSLYICTGANDILSLSPETGRINWRFQARINPHGVSSGTCRGVSYYRVPGASGACAERVYTATGDGRLLAVDARTGLACRDFGNAGAVNLRSGLGDKHPDYYRMTSPAQLVRGKLVVGGWIADGQMIGAPSGVIRAFDAVTGRFAWAWDLGNPGYHGEPEPGKTFTPGTPNSWAPMSADEQLGLVYVPTGNATPDYFGAHRSRESEEYTAAVVALDAETGAPRWHFRTVHHDIWDYDVSVQPALVDLRTSGGIVPAVVQGTKQGEVFVLDRRNGRPIFPVVERPVPQGAVAGDWVSKTQPHSAALPSFTGPVLTERDMWGVTPVDQAWCRILFRKSRYEGLFTPMDVKPTIVQPGYNGGIEWGSLSFDPARQLVLFVSNYMVNRNRLLTRAEADERGLRPTDDARKAAIGTLVPQAGTPYGAETLPFMSPLGTPCQKPPFSRLNAIDLRTGKLAWSRPLGNARSIGPLGWKSHLSILIGTPSFGGPITTASGLTFVAATLDGRMRAFDTRTGKVLWQADLPADGTATPMTYAGRDGRQYVVIAVADPGGGVQVHSSAGKAAGSGGTIMAFALPKKAIRQEPDVQTQ